MIRVFTAFSGYDSQCMALDRIGIDYDLVGWSEIDKNAIRAHDAVYPQYATRNYGDISKIDWSSVQDFDLFTYSSPCQSVSSVGRRDGIQKDSGTKSSLLWECEKAIRSKRPKCLLFENVKNLLSAKFIKAFQEWQLTLERLGYSNFTKVLDAQNYGVPQHRERVFMVSIRDCKEPYYFPRAKPIISRLKSVIETSVGGGITYPRKRWNGILATTKLLTDLSSARLLKMAWQERLPSRRQGIQIRFW